VSEYESGDVNVDGAAIAHNVLTYLATKLADEPEAVSVTESDSNGKTVFSLSVAPGDMGRIIGRRGRTAMALRSLVAAAGARGGLQTSVDIVD
jgi:predicted RNA-binding protein YlqC (UPF0109 family)